MKRILTDLADALRFGVARRRRGPGRFLAAAVAFAAALLVLLVTWSGWLYPLRPDSIGAIGHPFTADPLFDTAWGGPTLAGAWAVHAAVAAGIQVVCLAAIRWLSGTRDRVAVQ